MSETPPQLRRSARRLRLAALFGIALVELVILFAAWVVYAGRQADFPGLAIASNGAPPLAAALALLLFGLLIGLALLRLVAMLRAVEGGAPFAAAGLRGFARYLFCAMLASILAPPLFALTLGGVHRIDLSIGSGEALMVLVSALLFFVARLLDEARRLADDHSQIV